MPVQVPAQMPTTPTRIESADSLPVLSIVAVKWRGKDESDILIFIEILGIRVLPGQSQASLTSVAANRLLVGNCVS